MQDKKFYKIREIFLSEDLLKIVEEDKSNQDEYDPEIRELLLRISAGDSEKLIAQKINEIFQEFFGVSIKNPHTLNSLAIKVKDIMDKKTQN